MISTEYIDGLVSIIMPAYNSEKYIRASIQSVLNQVYDNWELIVIDDQSTDKTVEIIQSYVDERIKLIQLPNNSGAAIARNKGIELARGEYLAFLDSDDLWTKEKLVNQLNFMKENNYLFTSTKFAHMNENLQVTTIVDNHEKLDYDGVLKFCPGNSTVMYNAKKLGKFYIPNIKKRNDFVMWLKVIKKVKYLYGLDEVNTIYRIREDSLSIDKKNLLKYQWTVYRDFEGLSYPKSFYLLTHKILSVAFKVNQRDVNKSDDFVG